MNYSDRREEILESLYFFDDGFIILRYGIEYHYDEEGDLFTPPFVSEFGEKLLLLV